MKIHPVHEMSGKENGSALVIAIVFLLILTVLGLVGMKGAVLEERMTGNTRDRELGFRAAEAALREAEEFLQQPVLPPFNDPGEGLYGMDGTLLSTLNWDNADSKAYQGSLEGVSQVPRYVIEELPAVSSGGDLLFPDEPLPDDRFFRISARGIGGSQTAVVILQSTYRR
ncbi:MAG: PilX N-terminal domain-containing pilus assembly protein [Desulfovibrionales bacterium]